MKGLQLGLGFGLGLWFGAICFAGDILRPGAGSGTGTSAASAFYGSNQAALSQLQTDVSSRLAQITRALQSVQEMQNAARAAAQNGTNSLGKNLLSGRPLPNVPNGLAVNGLQVAPGAANNSSLWQGANLPTQSTVNGQTVVTINQNASKALLTWQTFNIGKNTIADFDQSAGGSSAHTWVAVNQVKDPTANPTQILGAIQAQGQVYILNANGVIFGGSSQINVGSLVAAATTTPASQVFQNGLYQTYAAGSGSIVVQSGAQIIANAPQTTTTGGGFVILLGNSVTNSGSISTPNGQTLIAAGQSFLLRQGYSIGPSSSTQNTTSTTVGTEAEVTNGGKVTNSGLIASTTGDITLVGGQVTQAGITIATTSVSKRGTIHLLTDASDPTTSVTLAPGSVTLVEPDPNSGPALNPQRANAYTEEPAYGGLTSLLNDEVGLPDKIGLSRIEITTGGTVNFAAGSLTSATAGQIEVSAGTRVFAAGGAELDVSGLVGVTLPMSANNLAVNIQGFELRDDPQNRDTKTLFNSTVWVDINQLVEVPASSAYSQNRYYTSGGVFEVSGELNNVQHSIDEWSTVGGSIVLSAPQAVARHGSVFDIAGGTINYQSGYLKQSWLIGQDGRLYNANTAPASMVYTGVWSGFQVNHPRWNVVETYQDVISAPSQIPVASYTVGRDAGTLTIDAPTARFAGTVEAGTYAGSQQNASRPSTVGDPFLLPQKVVPLDGSLMVEPYPTFALTNGTWVIVNPLIPNTNNVVFTNETISTPESPSATLSADVQNTDVFSAQQINAANLGGLTVDVEAPAVTTSTTASGAAGSGKGLLKIEASLTFAPGAQITLTAAAIHMAAGIVAPGGNVSVTSDAYPAVGGVAVPTPVTGIGINLAAGAAIDTRGLWTNAELDPHNIGGEAYVNGGSVSLVSDRGLILGTGSLIDTSSGGEISQTGKISGGAGGNITVEADLATTAQDQVVNSPVVLNGTLRSYGVTHGGALTLQGHSFLIANQSTGLKWNQLWIAPGFFNQGFSSYTLFGLTGVTVAPGTQITVTEPVYQLTSVDLNLPTGANPSAAFGSPVLMPVYLPNLTSDTFTQRPGASLTLEAGVNHAALTTQSGNTVSGVTVGGITMATRASITVDPGQSVILAGNGQITVDGTINAPSGSILIGNTRSLGGGQDTYDVGALSIWIGSNSRLNVSGHAITAVDTFGRVFGFVTGAGSIFLGGFGTLDTGGGNNPAFGEAPYQALAPNVPVNASEEAPTDAFVIVRPGAQLNAEGSAALVDTNLQPVAGLLGPNTVFANSSLMAIASNGGSIAFDSFTSIFLDGSFNAHGGGNGASGGSLTVDLFAPRYDKGTWNNPGPPGDMVDPMSFNPIYGSDPFRTNFLVPDRMRQLRIITIGSNPQSSGLSLNIRPGRLNPKLIAGKAYLSTQMLAAAGFANLTLTGGDGVVFRGNVTLKMPESISLSTAVLADTKVAGQARIIAPYVLLNAIGGASNSLAESLGNGNLSTAYDTAPLGPNDSSSFYRASLTVDADLIDLESTFVFLGSQQSGAAGTVGGTLQFGASVSYTVANGSTAQVNYATFPQITLVSQGDIRFLAGSTGGGTLSAPANLSLIAAQIYPTTGANWTVQAGPNPSNGSQYIPGTSLVIGRVNAQTPAVPDSVFGELTFNAVTINQGGIIRAPLGDLNFQEQLIPGPNGQSISSKSGINFLPGSITSVSANGLTTQYGGTTNGSVYTVNGNAVTLYDPLTGFATGASISLNGLTGLPGSQLGIHIATTGALLTVDKGALLDLSGGGNLTGAGFISGEGGSVDVLSTPLANANPILNSFSSSTDGVYAIVPGFKGYAPVAGGTSTTYTGGVPSIGQQITLPSGIPGLAAGTYTLLPANYALLPGAFRVELGKNSSFTQAPVVSVGNGSYLVQSDSAVANTGFHGTTPIQTIVTLGTKVRDYSDYDEESYTSFIVAQGQQYSRPRAMIPADASLLSLSFGIPNSPALAMRFQGTANFAPANGGISGSLLISSGGNLEILAAGSAPSLGWTGTSVAAAAINAIGAPNVFIGGILDPVSSLILAYASGSGSGSIVLRQGALLTGAQVDLISRNAITIETGAGIDALGFGAPNVDSSQGYLFTNTIPGSNGNPPTVYSAVVVSNGYVDLSPGTAAGTGNIQVDSNASLYSEGSIGFATPGNLVLGTRVNYGARYLDFSVQDVNIGNPSALNRAQAQGTLPPGLILTQDLLTSLLRGNPAIGAPALQILTLAASQSINFYGSVDLNTIDPATGKSSLQELVLDTPAVYGAGASGDTATITTGTLVWNGLRQVVIQTVGFSNVTLIADTPPGPVIANGPGTGSGTLNIVAEQIVFGYPATDQPQNNTSLSRLALGFSTVNLTATQEITANNKGTLSVYQAQTGANYNGGNLNLITPLLTGDSGSVMNYKVGGALTLSSPVGISAPTTMPNSLGAEINFSASSISNSTSIVAGTGKVTLSANGDIDLLPGSLINVAGQVVPMFDQNVATWGGDVSLESTQGNVIQSAGSVINLSAIGNDAGTLEISATSGQVQLAGILLGSTTGNFNAGSFNVRAQTIGDFVALNTLLDTGGFFYSRIFDIKQGNLTVPASTTIRATDVEIAIDNGSLTVAGTIDASGAKPGTIRLSAANNLQLTSTAVLDVHNTVLQVDSYGQPIDAENRGTIELTVAGGNDTSTANLNNGQGNLLLAAGATINMSSPDGVARGDLELNVPRTGETSGDIRISAAGHLNIAGAQTIALNAFWTYAPTDPNGTIVQSAGSGVPSGAIILDQVNIASVAFIDAAETNAKLQSAITGLTAYGGNFHLRPGVEIVSATPNGNLTIEGDLDLSRYRYGPNANVDPNSPGYGSGEPGVLVIRAGGNLNIYGSITDGFKQPPASPDDNGWVLYSGLTAQDIVVPIPVTLSAANGSTYPTSNVSVTYSITTTGSVVGTAFAAGAPISGVSASGQNVSFNPGQIVPVGTVLTVIPAGTNLSNFSGSYFPGSTQLQPSTISLAGDLTLSAGSRIPSGTNIAFDNNSSGFPPSYIALRNSAGVSGSAASSPNNQGATWPIASMLPAGDLSWSIRLVAGADTSSADTRTVLPASKLALLSTPTNPNPGSLTLSDLHYMDPTNPNFSSPFPQNFSVLRTGTGNLDLLAGGSFSEESVYGIYTAGTQSPGVTVSFNLGRDGLAPDGTIAGTPGTNVYNQIADTIANGGTYQANYPQGGGNLFLAAQGDLTGFTTVNGGNQASAMVGYWLWRQGGAGINQQTAWWINFGTYAYDPSTGSPALVGFTGIGTLGGGNVTIAARGNAGVTVPSFSETGTQSGSLVVAVGSTGRVQNGVLVQTGGGDVTINVGEGLNPAFFQGPSGQPAVLADGEFVDVRGDITIKAGSVGGVYLSYGSSAADDPRATSPFEAGLLNTSFLAAGLQPLYGGPILVPGDSSITIESRGDLVVSAAGDPGRVPDSNATNATTTSNWTLDPSVNGEGYTWFSLWTQSTSIRLYSAGGNLSPVVYGESGQDDLVEPAIPPTAYATIYPPSLTAIATSGSLYFFAGFPGSLGSTSLRLELAPAPNGQLELLAGKSIYGDPTYESASAGYAPPFQIDISGADSAQLPNPFNPAWYLYAVATSSNGPSVGVGGPSAFPPAYATTGNTSPNGTANIPASASSGQAYGGPGALFAFEADSATGLLHANDPSPALIYAVTGDIVDLGFGQIFNAISFQNPSGTGDIPWYIMAKAVQVRAGRDIVNFGQSTSVSPTISTNQPNFILNNSPSDVSVISAGRDILFANVDIYGPGTLEVSAGRNIVQAGQENGSVVEGVLDSKGLLGNARTQNPNGGASVITLGGVGSYGPDWSAFENLYLNPANLANSSELLVNQPGKVVQTYQDELYAWLQQYYKYAGSQADELTYFESLPVPRQSVFLLQVYFDELNQSGLEYNDPTSPFYQTYVRGEEAIRTLFPSVGPKGQPISYNGSLTLYSQFSSGATTPGVFDSAILTEFGGGITVVDPGGQVLVGAQGVTPGSTAGILTEGSGDINIYSEGSVLLGLARILTTFGGNIVIWSQNGDINAGKGAKGTVIFAPAGVSYDEFANLTLSPTVPSTGAGIGALQPIPDVPPGNVNLVAPNGVIDLGEAGLRASGNANLAARVIINAANISVAGKVTGIPTVVGPNVAAVTAANNVAGANSNVASEIARQQVANSQQEVLPSVIIVEVLGYGGGDE